MKPVYEFKIDKVERIVDGDSFWLWIELPFRTKKLINCRLLGVDTWETRGVSKEHKIKGLKAKEFVSEWFYNIGTYWVRTHKAREWDNFGRVLAEVFYDQNGISFSLAQDLIDNGHVK